MIAPHIISKTTDPAVISVDEQGKFAVSLLSGHIGGGNALAEKIAGIIGAVPVITTATDIGKKFSPDSFACANGLHILETDIAKDIAAAVVNGEKIGIFSDYPYVNLPHEFFGDSAENGISISCDTAKIPFKNTLHLVPKNIIIGVGCRKNTDSDLLSEFILNMLKVNDIPLYRVVGMHTIDIKKDETAILNFADRNNIPLKFYSAKELMQVEGEFSHSAFVAKITGADNICERSAAVGGNTLIVRKHAENGMTFAAAESEIILDFERKIL
jgi:cobalt-precorrin 5A hydrolase